MLDSIIGAWRLYKALRPRRTEAPPLPAHCLIALRRSNAREWLISRGVYDIKALGPSHPPPSWGWK
jgi:hypothetical protein